MKNMKKKVIAFVAMTMMVGTVITGNIHAESADKFLAKVTFKMESVDVQVDVGFTITDPVNKEVSLTNYNNYSPSCLSGDLVIPETVKDGNGTEYKVTSIGDGAFMDQDITSTGLENNESVKSIGNYAFRGCFQLKSTGLDNNTTVTSLGEDAFLLCNEITSVIFPKQIKDIKRYTFSNCSKLETFVFSGEIPTIAEGAFDSATQIYYPEGVNTDNLTNANIGTSKISSYKLKVSISDGYKGYHVGKIYSAEQITGINQYVIDGKDVGGTEISKEDLQNNLVLTPDQKLVAGTNTINGTYNGMPISFEVNASDHDTGEWKTDIEPTTTSTGLRTKRCTICLEELDHQVIEKLPIVYTYDVLESEENYIQGTKKDMTYRIDGDYNLFTGVKMDGKELSQEHYTASQGSTVITLKSAYLETLTEGNHEITVMFNGNDVKISLAIKPDPNQTSNKPNNETPLITPDESLDTTSSTLPSHNTDLEKQDHSTTNNEKIIKTSDETAVLIYMEMLVCSVIAGCFVFKKRKNI